MTGATLAVWVLLPYVSITIFVVGHVWRYRHDQFGWTARSTQLLERRLLKWGSPLFHFGALAAIGGHVVGMLIPEQMTSALGVSEDLYHEVSAWAGTAAGIVCLAGLLILLYRRIKVRRIAVTTSLVDVPTFALLFLIILLGLVETAGVNLIGGGYDYRLSVAIWFRGIFMLNPQPQLMVAAPMIYQLHAAAAWLLFALWPFSRLVHAWSVPITYVGRPYILYRRRFAPVQGRPPAAAPR